MGERDSMSKAQALSGVSHYPGAAMELDRIVLPVAAGERPNQKPPVRIFLGTESAQYRADRVLVWSIERVRDPSRVYEISLLRDLSGFDRRGWTTSFTNYRFAIPSLLGAGGRAIYNDEDQIYLRDPAELFDLELGGHGYRAVSASDTSVMLLDAEKMASVWGLEASQQRSKKALLAAASSVPGLYGELDPCWNIRDQEVSAELAGCLHFTTLHTQPWRPFPNRFVYDRHPDEGLWFELEREANEAGFRLFSKNAPSRAFADFSSGKGTGASGEGALDAGELECCDNAIARLVRLRAVEDVLEVAGESDAGGKGAKARWSVPGETHRVSLRRFLSDSQSRECDAVVSLQGLGELSYDDAGWAVDELFRHARRFVFARVRCREPLPPAGRRGPPAGTAGTGAFWEFLFETAAIGRPGVHWEIALEGDPRVPPGALYTVTGGAFPTAEPPRVVVLGGASPAGETLPSQLLARALGWPFETKTVSASGARTGAGEFGPPWPDLLVSSGAEPARVARAVRVASRGRTRCVHLGEEGADPATAFDLTVVSASAQLFPHPNRFETLGPLVPRQGEDLALARAIGEQIPRPRLVLLAGGGCKRRRITASFSAQLGQDVCALSEKMRASLLVATVRELPPDEERALRAQLGVAAEVTMGIGQDSELERLLALGDLFVVVGDDEALLARVCGVGRPVFIAPVPETWPGLPAAIRDRFRKSVLARARAKPQNQRGTTRPQKWGELLFSRCFAKGWVRPVPAPGIVHRELIARNKARFFGEPVAPTAEFLDEVGCVAARVRAMLGVAPVSHSRPPGSPGEPGEQEGLSLRAGL